MKSGVVLPPLLSSMSELSVTIASTYMYLRTKSKWGVMGVYMLKIDVECRRSGQVGPGFSGMVDTRCFERPGGLMRCSVKIVL